MASNVTVGSPDWRCIRAVSMSGGCATPDCSIGRVCGDRTRVPDLMHHDWIGRSPPGRVAAYDAAQRVVMGRLADATDTVAALALMLRGELAVAGGASFGSRMVDRFMAGTGGTMEHAEGSELASLARRAGNVPAFIASLRAALTLRVAQQFQASRTVYDLAPGDLPWVEFPIGNASPEQPSHQRTLAAVIGGTKGNKVFIRNLRVEGSARTFRMEARIEICDHFGVDETDLYSPGLIAFWKLQHARPGSQRPFVNLIVLNESITGRLGS
jgi:hypothetical protein